MWTLHRYGVLRVAGAVLGMTVLLQGCSSLPRSGPTQGAIHQDAAVVLAATGEAPYVVVQISEGILSFFSAADRISLADGFGGGRSAAPSLSLGAGDVVEVSIFESQAGGLFIPVDGSRPGNYITLPTQVVDQQGMITVPYAGAIKVTGRPVSQVQDEIEGLLEGRAIDPQVIITTTTNRSNRISILGDVNAPADMDISPRGERVLDIVARAGGLRAPGLETYVTIERKGRRATALFSTIVEDPRENIYVAPGDTVYVSRERRTYLAFGAAGLNGRFDFEEFDLTLGEALAKAGGLLDNRADPSQVFLYREVDPSILYDMNVYVSPLARGDGLVPVIFQADLRRPEIFFAIQKFTMQDKDLIYVSNSSSTELSKFLDIIDGITDTTANVPGNAVLARKAIRDFSD